MNLIVSTIFFVDPLWSPIGMIKKGSATRLSVLEFTIEFVELLHAIKINKPTAIENIYFNILVYLNV